MKKFLIALLALATALAITPAAIADTSDYDPAVSLSAGNSGALAPITINSNSDWAALTNPVQMTPLGSPLDQNYIAGSKITSLLITATPQATVNGQPAPASDYTCNASFGMKCVITLEGNYVFFYMSGGSIPVVPMGTNEFQLTAQGSKNVPWPSGETFTVQENVPNVPEPSSLALLGTGLLGLAIILFRKAKPSRLVLDM